VDEVLEYIMKEKLSRSKFAHNVLYEYKKDNIGFTEESIKNRLQEIDRELISFI